ncbi:MAG: XTP/dITP diphosphatase [Desulfurococcaceae archaeon]
MAKLCFVTSNIHKYNEVKPIAESLGIELELCTDLKLEIQSDSIEEVVLKSAMIAYAVLSKPVLVEDAGLFIEALNGFPGPYSSYVYRTIGIKGILKLMEGVKDRRACFKSASAVAFSKGVIVATGEVHGEIVLEPRGDKGFGFDPIFIPVGESRTFAEMTIEEKNSKSHRAISTRRVLEKYLSLAGSL